MIILKRCFNKRDRRSFSDVQYRLTGFFQLIEYCGQFEPLMRNLEPASAGDKAGQCGR